MPEFPERKQCVSQVVGHCFCRNENRYPTFTYGRGHVRLFLYWEGSIPPTKHPRQNYKLLEPIRFPPCAVCPATYWAHSVPPDSDLYSYSPDVGGRHCFTGCSYSKPNGECQACCAQYAQREPALVFLAQYESPNNQSQAEQSREYHNPETHVLDLSLKFDDSIMLVSQGGVMRNGDDCGFRIVVRAKKQCDDPRPVR